MSKHRQAAFEFNGSRLRTLFMFFQLISGLLGGIAPQQLNEQRLNVGDYLKWLTLLKTLSTSLPAFLAWLQEGFDLFAQVFPQPDVNTLQVVELPAEVETAENDVLAMVEC